MVKRRMCSVLGCGEEAVRSLDEHRVKQAGLPLTASRRAYLCKNHYKVYKKKTKKERTMQRLRWGN